MCAKKTKIPSPAIRTVAQDIAVMVFAIPTAKEPRLVLMIAGVEMAHVTRVKTNCRAPQTAHRHLNAATMCAKKTKIPTPVIKTVVLDIAVMVFAIRQAKAPRLVHMIAGAETVHVTRVKTNGRAPQTAHRLPFVEIKFANKTKALFPVNKTVEMGIVAMGYANRGNITTFVRLTAGAAMEYVMFWKRTLAPQIATRPPI